MIFYCQAFFSPTLIHQQTGAVCFANNQNIVMPGIVRLRRRCAVSKPIATLDSSQASAVCREALTGSSGSRVIDCNPEVRSKRRGRCTVQPFPSRCGRPVRMKEIYTRRRGQTRMAQMNHFACFFFHPLADNIHLTKFIALPSAASCVVHRSNPVVWNTTVATFVACGRS